MTLMILPISFEALSIRAMAAIASPTMRPDSSALVRVSPTMRLASSARWVAVRTVTVISSRAADVCSSEAACRSVRRARSSAAVRIWRPFDSIESAFSLTLESTTRSRSTVWLKFWRS
ncbi:hypothetical protein D9M72_598760 [compost metagenome]